MTPRRTPAAVADPPTPAAGVAPDVVDLAAAERCVVIERSTSFRPGRNVVRAGDAVRIAGKRGLFRFVALARNPATGAQWVEVVGPEHNPRSRSFRPEQLRRLAVTSRGVRRRPMRTGGQS